MRISLILSYENLLLVIIFFVLLEIKERDALAREKDEAYSNAWVYYKDANERWNNEYVSHKANLNKKYSSIYERYLKAVEKANKFIAICKAYESRENILRTINANLRKG